MLNKDNFFYNDSTGALLNETDTYGMVTASYVSDDKGRPISVTRGSQTYFYHLNGHGDVIAITDSLGATVAKVVYNPWGVPTEYDKNGAAVPLGTWAGTPSDGLFFLFGSMLYDAATGLYLTRTRAYNPRIGRFLQRDILDESGKNGVYKGFPFGKDAIGTNLYAWCGNNPVSRVDPSGMAGFLDWIRTAASVAVALVNVAVNAVSNVNYGVGVALGNAISGGARRLARNNGGAAAAIEAAVPATRKLLGPVSAPAPLQPSQNKYGFGYMSTSVIAGISYQELAKMQAEFNAKVTSDIASIRALQAANASKFSDAGEAFTFLHELAPKGIDWSTTKLLPQVVKIGGPAITAGYVFFGDPDQTISEEAEQAQIRYFETKLRNTCQYCFSGNTQ